jgi:threonine/homoserine/homoserine lactone efflux protein
MDRLYIAIRANSHVLNVLEIVLAYVGLLYLLYLSFLASRGGTKEPAGARDRPVRLVARARYFSWPNAKSI